MCRSDIRPAARGPLGAILGSLAAALAESAGISPDEVLIGPVDFGDEDAADRIEQGDGR